jgi:hypothetical protein
LESLQENLYFFNCIFGVVSIGLRCLGLPVEITIIYLYFLLNSTCGVKGVKATTLVKRV